MLRVIFDSKNKPEVPGYPDRVKVEKNFETLYTGNASCCPNPFKPQNNPKENIPWEKAYGWILPGIYPFLCVDHNKYHKSLLINGGGILPARYPNVNHGQKNEVSECFVHCGYSEAWRGSMGCLTIPPKDWHTFIGCFNVGDKGEVEIRCV